MQNEAFPLFEGNWQYRSKHDARMIDSAVVDSRYRGSSPGRQKYTVDISALIHIFGSIRRSEG